MNKPTNQVSKIDKNISDNVLARVNEFQELGELILPKGYSPGNALKSAYLKLQDTKTKDNQPVLTACTQESVANTLFEMVCQGLSPMKNQCAFIAYGNKLTLSREYHGTIALAKRYGEVLDVKANVIYKDDSFEYEIDSQSGNKLVTKHEQSFSNLDGEIIGAYATLIMNNGTIECEIMTIKQIRASWNQGATNGNSPAHKNFPDQMAMKTVINRACKLKITSSDDSTILSTDDDQDHVLSNSQETIQQNANAEEIGFEEVEEPVIKGKVTEPTDEQAKDERVPVEEDWMQHG